MSLTADPSILVLYIHTLDELPTGTQRRVWNLLKGLVDSGWNVDVLVPGSTITRSERAGVYIWSYKAPPRSELEKLGPIGFPFQVYHDLVAPSMVKLARRILDAHRPSLIQAEHVWTAIPTARLAVRSGLPWIHDSHAVESDVALFSPSRIYREYVHRLETRACQSANHILAVSEADAERFQELYGIDSARISVVPNGVNVAEFAEAPRQPPRGFRPAAYIVFHGSYHYGPNRLAFLWMVQVLAPWLQVHHPETRLLLAGEHPPEVPLPSNVVAPGFLSDGELRSALRCALAAVIPVTAGSGTRVKMLEYMAAGKAVVSTQKGVEGLPVCNGRHALVPDNLNGEFLQLVGEVIRDRSLRNRLGRAAQLLVQSFDWSDVVDRCIQAYSRIAR